MPRTVSPEEVERLAALAGLRFPSEDLGPLAEALAAHLVFVEPLLVADLADAPSALTLDARWRD